MNKILQNMSRKRRIKEALALAAVACLAVGSLKAAMVDYQIGNGGLEDFDLTYNTSSGNTTINGALVGGIAITMVPGGTASSGLPATYTTVCTDIGASVYLGSTYGYDLTTFAGQSGIRPNWGYDAYNGHLNAADLATEQSEAIQNAAEIFNTHLGVLSGSSTTDKAALQLAVWAAVYNTGLNGQVNGITQSGGNYNLSSGRFTVSAGDQAAINEAAGWLLSVNGAYTLNGYLLFPDPNTPQGNGDGLPVQELLLPVPEPTTMIAGALLLLPLGARTLRFLRRNHPA